MIKFKKVSLMFLIIMIIFSVVMTISLTAFAEKSVKLVLSTMLPPDHLYARSLEVFKEKVMKYYDGPLEVELHNSGDLGTEKDVFEYMMQGVAVDISMVSPSWMANLNKTAAFMSAPFLFKNLAAWKEAIVEKDVFKPIAEDLKKQGIRFLGFYGGTVRNFILRKPVWKTADLPTVELRCQGSPISQKVFNAIGVKATPLDYTQVYNAIKTGVIDGLENPVPGYLSMKFYEVAPYYVKTKNEYFKLVLCVSEKRFQSFPEDLQKAILKAGEDTCEWERTTGVSEEATMLEEAVEAGKVKVIEFPTTEIRKRAQPVIEEFAKEVGAYDIFLEIQEINNKN